MTTVENNTFAGPNAGVAGGYVPLTTIESTSMDGDLNLVKDDLDYHLSILQAIYTKLDTIEAGAAATPSASTMVSTINASAELIDADNLEAIVALLSNIISNIEAHRVTTTQSAMHTEDSIKSTDQTYSYTPSSIVTSCQNVLDEINNIRTQIHKILGQSTWIDTPDTTIAEIKTKLDTIESAATVDQTGAEIKALYEIESEAYTDAKDSKLSGIESNSTADQTGAEIKALYEIESEAYTDAKDSKLSGIESNSTADQTESEIRDLVASASDSNVFTDALKLIVNNIPINIWSGGIGFGSRYPNDTLIGTSLISDADKIYYGFVMVGTGEWVSTGYYWTLNNTWLELLCEPFYNSIEIEFIRDGGSNNTTSYLDAWTGSSWVNIVSLSENGITQTMNGSIPANTTKLRVRSSQTDNHGTTFHSFRFYDA